MTNKLIPLDLFVYNRIKFFTEKKQGFCYETNRSLAEITGRSIPRISNSISKLIKNGYVVNEGTLYRRQLKITSKKPTINLNLNDMTHNLNDMTLDAKTISERITYLHLNDKPTLTKTIRDLNLNDNIVEDLVEELSRRISKRSKKTKLVDSFCIGKDTKQILNEEGYGKKQIERNLNAFKDYWINGKGKNTLRENWDVSFRGWIRKEPVKEWEEGKETKHAKRKHF